MTWTKEIADGVSEISGVTGVVISDKMGVLIDGGGDDDNEKRAILLAYLGEIACSVGESMSFEGFRSLVLAGESETLLVFTFQDHLVGVRTDNSPDTGEIQRKIDQLLKKFSGKEDN